MSKKRVFFEEARREFSAQKWAEQFAGEWMRAQVRSAKRQAIVAEFKARMAEGMAAAVPA